MLEGDGGVFSEASSDGELYVDSRTELDCGDGDFADLTAFLSVEEINRSLDLAREAFGDTFEPEDLGPPQEQALQPTPSLPVPPQTTENPTPGPKQKTTPPCLGDNAAVKVPCNQSAPLSRPVQVGAPSPAETLVCHKPVMPVYKQDKPRLVHESLELNDRAASASEFCSRAATFIEELSSIFKGSAHLERRVEEDSSSPDSGYLSPKSQRPVPQGSASAPSLPPGQQEQRPFNPPAMVPPPAGPGGQTAPASGPLSPPCFLQKLKSQEVAEGSPIRLECRVSGTPLPLVR